MIYFLYTVQQLLQAAAAPSTATELLGLLAPSDMPSLPRRRHTLREAAELLLHQTGLPVVSAVAITVGGAGNLSRHLPCCRTVGPGPVAPSPRLAPRAQTRRQHQHGLPTRHLDRGVREQVPHSRPREFYRVAVVARPEPRNPGDKPGRVSSRALLSLAAAEARGAAGAARAGAGRLRAAAPAHGRALDATLLQRLHRLSEPDCISHGEHDGVNWTSVCVEMLFFLNFLRLASDDRNNFC